MSAHLSEEEQLENLKRWWQENGKSTLLGVVLAVAGWFGWEAWQGHQTTLAEEGAVKYQELLQAVSAGDQLDDEQTATARHLAEQLKADYDSTPYAQYAALFMAKLAVNADDLDSAASELRWVLAQSPEPALAATAGARLARVLSSQGEHEQALALLDGLQPPAAFASLVAEVRGDLLVALDRPAEARVAYEQALAEMVGDEQNRAGLLQMKLNDLAPAPQTPAMEPAA